MLTAIPATPDHLMAIDRHPDQAVQLGLDAEMTLEVARDVTGAGNPDPWGEAWALFWRGALVACCGLRISMGGAHVVAWAIIGRGIGAAHLAATRFMRARVHFSPFTRIEAVCLANDADPILARWPDLDAQQLVDAVMVRPSRECRFALLSGLKPAHVLRRYGAAAETYMLFERIR